MRIGIVTQPLLDNYGGILQNFALQQVLKRLGHHPVTLDYVSRKSLFRYLWRRCILYFFSGKKRSFWAYKKVRKRQGQMEVFVNKYIEVTSPVFRYTSNLVDQYRLEAVITGSDQVWRPSYNKYLEDMYLRFVIRPDVKKLAYAASFGTEDWEYTSRQRVRCARLAKQFKAVSVRETSGISLCKENLGVDALETLDPTLLLDQEDYIALCREVVSSVSSPFLVAYVLDVTEEKEEFIRNIAQKKGLEVQLFSAGQTASLSMEEWLAMYRDAAYVVTDSFHGTVFSILFNKPFVVLGNVERGMSRFHSLLQKFSLENRLVTDVHDSSFFDDVIDWEKVNRIRTELKTFSIEFIKSNLN